MLDGSRMDAHGLQVLSVTQAPRAAQHSECASFELGKFLKTSEAR